MIWLIFAHFIGDFALQTDWQAQNKGKLWYVMLVHCMIWTACICVALQYLGLFHLGKAVFLVAIHFLIDVMKSGFTDASDPEDWWLIYPDQALHFLQCAMVYYLP